jgi:hypothetical protein
VARTGRKKAASMDISDAGHDCPGDQQEPCQRPSMHPHKLSAS